jgi:hypothetical protein
MADVAHITRKTVFQRYVIEIYLQIGKLPYGRVSIFHFLKNGDATLSDFPYGRIFVTVRCEWHLLDRMIHSETNRINFFI